MLHAVVAVSGNKAQGLALVWENLPIHQTLELIETVIDNTKNTEDTEDLW